jgi:hypothetical protein
MTVTLMGPDDLGFWFLTNDNGNSFPLVESHEDHPAAAAQLGWKAPKGVTDKEALIDSAIDFLMENIGEEIEAPKHVDEFFKNLEAENEE